jgi:anti-anti-sigma factor
MSNGVHTSVRDLPPLLVIDLRGEVTSLAEGPIFDAYRRAVEQGAGSVLLNFSGVDYVNSGGISIIIGVLAEARKADRRILVTGLTPHYRKVFEMMGLSRYAPVFDTEEAARDAVSPGEDGGGHGLRGAVQE